MWNENCAQIFSEVVREYEQREIEYFVLRNTEGLPERNDAKDVDIVVNPSKIKEAKKVVKQAYKNNGCEYYFENKKNLTHGISLEKLFGIHIDLLPGIVIKGFEIETFDHMYMHANKENGFFKLDKTYENFLLYITKTFGIKNPELSEKHRNSLQACAKTDHTDLIRYLEGVMKEETEEVIIKLEQGEFDSLLDENKEIGKYIKKTLNKKQLKKNLIGRLKFGWEKFVRIILCYRKHKMVMAFIGPDGSGKSSVIDNIEQRLAYFLQNENVEERCNLLHFRPTIFPNLGELAAKRGREQDTDFERPHRNEPAGSVSSFFRMGYYTLDYLLGWQKVVRQDVKNERVTIFDRYGYDFLVDPQRSKIKLPMLLRKFFVALMPKPQVTFVMMADAETIYSRKQELDKGEIERQIGEYEKLARKRGFYALDASGTVNEASTEAMIVIAERFFERIN